MKEIRLGRRTTNTAGGIPISANSFVVLSMAPLTRRISLKIMIAQIKKASSRERFFLASCFRREKGKRYKRRMAAVTSARE